MDKMNKIERMFDIAARESLPDVDISANFWAGVSDVDTVQVRPFRIAAVISLAAACVAIALAVLAVQSINNPLNELTTPLQTAALW